MECKQTVHERTDEVIDWHYKHDVLLEKVDSHVCEVPELVCPICPSTEAPTGKGLTIGFGRK